MSAISVSWLNVSWGAVYIETNYGLMQHSYIEIKDRLLNALDSEYNVVDMATVFDVVAVLEKTPITPEILESTRLGKVINECRRRTKNETLARRAKHLVRRWRNMIPPSTNTPASSSSTSSTTTSSSAVVPQQNGTNVRSPSTISRVGTAAISPLSSLSSRVDRVASGASISPALCFSSTSSSAGAVASRNAGVSGSSSGHHHHTSSTKLLSPSSSLVSSRSPLRDPKVESVPKTHVANKRLRKRAASPISGGGGSGDPPTKVAKMNGVMFAGQHHQQEQLHHHHHQLLHQVQQRDTTDRLLSPPSTFGSAAFAGTSADHHLVDDGDCDDRLAHVHQFATSVTATDTDDALLESPAMLVEVDDVTDRRHLHHHHHHHHHHAVATASTTMPEPEPDPPPSMTPTSTPKKRSRKKANKKKMSEDDIVREKLQALSKAGRVKTTEELVAELKSLNEDRLGGSGASTSEAAESSPPDIGSGGTTVKPSLSNNNNNNVLQRQQQQQHAMAAADGAGGGNDSNSGDVTAAAAAGAAGISDMKASLDHLDPEARVEREIADILAKLPPINPAEIRWDETPVPSPPSSPAVITEADVDRYLSQQWDGVNGCVTQGQRRVDDPLDNGFREWHEMVSRRTTNDDLIHILPYSIVD